MFCLTNYTPNLTPDNDHWMTVDCVDRVIRVGPGPGTWQCHPSLTVRDISLTSDHEVGRVRDEGVALPEAAGRHLAHPGPVVILVLGREDPEAAVPGLGVPGPLVLAGVSGYGRVVPLPPALALLVPDAADHDHLPGGVDLPVARLLLPLLSSLGPGQHQSSGHNKEKLPFKAHFWHFCFSQLSYYWFTVNV